MSITTALEMLPAFINNNKRWLRPANGELSASGEDDNWDTETQGPRVIEVPMGDALLYGSKVQNPFTGDFFSPAPVGTGPRHYVILDLDIEAHLIPSSTEGHSHLVLNHQVPESIMGELLDVLVRAGIVQEGIKKYQWDRDKELTLRLPWVAKGEDMSIAEQIAGVKMGAEQDEDPDFE